MQYLERMNGGKLRVVVTIPRDLQKRMGKTKLRRSLGTDSLAVANLLKGPIVQEFHRQMRAHQTGSQSDPLLQEALRIREDMQRAWRTGGDTDGISEAIVTRAEEIAGRPTGIDEDGEPIYVAESYSAAKNFAAVAFNRSTPLRSLVDRFYVEHRWDARTQADFERTLGYLEAWCAEEGHPKIIEGIDKRDAGAFVGSLVRSRGMATRTANKYLSTLSAYWRWLEKRGHVDRNVWEGQSLRNERRKRVERHRPFTSEEIKVLFLGQPRQTFMIPAMAIAALTGARLGAVVDLRVKDCAGGEFRFDARKHEVDDRRVPIHPDLRSLVEARTLGRKPDDDLFPDIPRLAAGADPRRERGQPLTKAFGRYREKMGVDEKRAGDNQSLVNFHSFRRWFITKAAEALNTGATGFSAYTIAEVVGHSVEDMALGITMGTYKDLDKREARRRCVEAVRLPEEVRSLLVSLHGSP